MEEVNSNHVNEEQILSVDNLKRFDNAMAEIDEQTVKKIMEQIASGQMGIDKGKSQGNEILGGQSDVVSDFTSDSCGPDSKIVIPTRIVKNIADDSSDGESSEEYYGTTDSSGQGSSESTSSKTDREDDGEISVDSSENAEVEMSSDTDGAISNTELDSGTSIAADSHTNSTEINPPNDEEVNIIKNTMNNLNNKYNNRSRNSSEQKKNNTGNKRTNNSIPFPNKKDDILQTNTHIITSTTTPPSSQDHLHFSHSSNKNGDVLPTKQNINPTNKICLTTPYDSDSAKILNNDGKDFKMDDVCLNDNSVSKSGTVNSTNTQDDTVKYFTIIHDVQPTDNSRCKKCPKMKFNGVKQWWKLQQNLAPRSRHFLRISFIVLGSALLLLAIFLLARLPHARKDVTHPAMYDLPSDDAFRPQLHPHYADLRESDINDLQDLPPLPQVDHPDVVGGEVIRVHEPIPVPSGDVDLRALARRKGIGYHPLLGVPVDQTFLNMEANRLNRLRAVSRNVTVQSVLKTVRETVEAERKQMKNKEKDIWAPDSTPLRILLVSTWRSGSTFLGQVLQQHPGVFQHYEPFSYLGVKQIRSGPEAFQSQQLLHRLLECRFAGQDEYLDYSAKNPVDMSGHNKRIWNACNSVKREEICSNSTFLTEACNMFPIQLVKTVRLRLNLTQLFLGETRLNAKVVFLVRDPRATMSSRKSSVKWCDSSSECSSSAVLCSDLQRDLKVSAALERLYPKSFTMIRYEDLANDPQNVVKQLLQFLGMEYSKQLSQFVAEHTESELDKPWSIARKSAARVSRWKEQLSKDEIKEIENSCSNVIGKLGYDMTGN